MWCTSSRIVRMAAMVALLARPGAAAERAGVNMPDTLTVDGKTLVLNGMGIRQATIFNINVYVLGLYVEQKSQNPEELIRSEQTKRLDLVLLRDVEHDEIVDAWRKGFKANGADMAKLKSRLD